MATLTLEGLRCVAPLPGSLPEWRRTKTRRVIPPAR
jgi:hypothetical protein